MLVKAEEDKGVAEEALDNATWMTEENQECETNAKEKKREFSK
jgi:hypothetical protein